MTNAPTAAPQRPSRLLILLSPLAPPVSVYLCRNVLGRAEPSPERNGEGARPEVAPHRQAAEGEALHHESLHHHAPLLAQVRLAIARHVSAELPQMEENRHEDLLC